LAGGMSKFEFCSVGRVVFGRGQFARVGEIAGEFGCNAIVIHNADNVLPQIAKQLSVGHTAFRQRGEPTVDDVDRAVETARRESCDVVIGLGGGSAIDLAKAAAGILTNGGSALDYMEVVGKGQKIAKPAVPWIAIPCTAGTGAEATRNAVIGYPPRKFKASLRSEHLLARVALVDPELGVHVPPDVTARSGMDALCQCIEAYTSNGAQPMVDALAMEGVRRAGRSLKRAFDDGSDIDAREDMALAALLSGISLTNAGLGAVHGFAAPLGASFPVPHGTVCAALLPGVMAANVQALRSVDAKHPTLARYADIGRTLMNRNDISDDAATEMGIDFVRGLCRDLRIPRLGHFGIGENDLASVSEAAKRSSSMRYNPVMLADATLHAILRQAM
jgi:alcohol dehydrogenase class IV